MKPAILWFARTKTGYSPPPLNYDSALDLNIIEHCGKRIPYIRLGHDLLEMSTKTENTRECDDEYFGLEFVTKTAQQLESDDE
jgi:hypothetical protein